MFFKTKQSLLILSLITFITVGTAVAPSKAMAAINSIIANNEKFASGASGASGAPGAPGAPEKTEDNKTFNGSTMVSTRKVNAASKINIFIYPPSRYSYFRENITGISAPEFTKQPLTKTDKINYSITNSRNTEKSKLMNEKLNKYRNIFSISSIKNALPLLSSKTTQKREVAELARKERESYLSSLLMFISGSTLLVSGRSEPTSKRSNKPKRCGLLSTICLRIAASIIPKKMTVSYINSANTRKAFLELWEEDIAMLPTNEEKLRYAMARIPDATQLVFYRYVTRPLNKLPVLSKRGECKRGRCILKC